MAGLWPRVDNGRELDALTPEALAGGIAVIAERHGWPVADVEPFEDGSLPVFAVGDDLVLKLYPPLYADDFTTESRVLAYVEGLAAPTVVDTGEVDGWRYVVMTRVVGVSLGRAWDAMPDADRTEIARQLGRWMAALHALPTTRLERLPSIPWPEFVARQMENATRIQAKRGVVGAWLPRIAPFLTSVDLRADGPSVLLHTEVMRAHVFMDRRARGHHAGRWMLTGLVDFEPSMVGGREYEFASVGLFTACGDRTFLRECLLGYGYDARDLDHEFQRRCMVWALLHRFSRLAWYLRRMPPEPGVDSFDALARQWWAM